MRYKSLLLLLALVACSKSPAVGSVDADAVDVEVCDGVCVVEVAGDVSPAVEVAQSVSPSEDTTETKILDALEDIQGKLDQLTGDATDE
jgi:hypothetical protein